MKSNESRQRRRRRAARRLIPLTILAGAPATAGADDFYYTGPSTGGVWDSSALFKTNYWHDDQTAGATTVPPAGAGANLDVSNASGFGTSNATVNLNYAYTAAAPLSYLSIASGNTLMQNVPSNAIYATNEYIGLRSNGTYTQSKGVNNATSLVLGRDANFAVPYQGVYNISGGTVFITNVSVGGGARGVINQSGGAAQLTFMTVGDSSSGPTPSAYNLSAGALTSASIAIIPHGQFVQTGGTATMDVLQDSGLYSLQGGTLAGSYMVIPGTLTATSPAVLTSISPDECLIDSSAGNIQFLGATLSGKLRFAPRSQFTATNVEIQGTAFFEDPLINGFRPHYNSGQVVRVDAGGTFLAYGDPVAWSFTNNGHLMASRGDLTIAGFSLLNDTNGVLGNEVGSNLFVDPLYLTNRGSIQVAQAGSVVFTAPLTVANPGTAVAGVTLAGGALSAPSITNPAGATITGFGGITTSNLSNSGTIFINGPSQFVCALNNQSGGKVVVANSQLLITGAAANAGTMTAQTGGSFVFAGGLSGNPVAGSPLPAGPVAPPALNGQTTLGPSTTLLASFVRQQTLSLGGTPGQPATFPTATIRPKAQGGDTSVLNVLDLKTDALGHPTARFDLDDNALVVNPPLPVTSSPLPAIRSSIVSAFATGSAGHWTGPGLTSSTAAGRSGVGLGYATAGDVLDFSGGGAVTWQGQTVGPDSVLVRYTLAGDATLDGSVGFNDLVRLAQNYGVSLAASTDNWWSHGDFNYDGVVDFSDLVALAQNYNVTIPTEPIPGAPTAFERELSAAFAAIPEPATAGLALTAACGLAAQRRRRKRTP